MTSYSRTSLVLLLAIRWTSTLHSGPGEGAEKAATDANIAVLVQGDVSVKRKGWSNYEPVVFGTNLRADDLVRVNPSSQAKVVCSDLTLKELSVGIGGVPCAPTRKVLVGKDGSVINVTRGGPPDGSYPVVLSPRKTKLLSANPTLQWTPVSGTQVYVIAIRGPQFFWAARGPGTEYAYPGRSPRLKPDIDYKLIVQAGDRSSSEEPGVGLGFSIVDGKERSSIENEQLRIERLGLPDGPTQFLIASFYATRELRAEAIQRLEKVSPQMKEAAVPRLLGELYLEVGLIRRAEARYLKALELCKAENDEEGQMLVHLALGNIYEGALGNNQLAKEHLDATLVLANKIGDESTAGLVGNRLAKLRKEGV